MTPENEQTAPKHEGSLREAGERFVQECAARFEDCRADHHEIELPTKGDDR